MECYACANQAIRQCRRCARVYCELHGGELCAECLSPASSLPSFNLYRGSLLALLIGTAVALWILVRPPGSGDGNEVIITSLTPTTVVTQAAGTATRAPRSRTPTAEAPTGATETAPLEATPTAAVRSYEVQPGDTLIGIAERLAPPGVSPFDYVDQIVVANGLSSADEEIVVGQILILP
jgi:hypothetical protein